MQTGGDQIERNSLEGDIYFHTVHNRSLRQMDSKNAKVKMAVN